MKKILTLIAFAIIATAAAVAQPRAVGGYIGLTSQGVLYQHSVADNQYIGIEIGSDLPANLNGRFGMFGAFDYNFIVASKPNSKGQFNFVVGPGVYAGYGSPGPIFADKHDHLEKGTFFGVRANIGFDYTFNCHVMLFAKLSPCLGLSVGKSRNRDTDVVETCVQDHLDRMLVNLVIPTIGVAYAF